MLHFDTQQLLYLRLWYWIYADVGERTPGLAVGLFVASLTHNLSYLRTLIQWRDMTLYRQTSAFHGDDIIFIGSWWCFVCHYTHRTYFFVTYELYCPKIWSYVSPLVHGILCKEAPPSKTYCTVLEHHVATFKMDFVVFQIVLTNWARVVTTFVIKVKVLVTKFMVKVCNSPFFIPTGTSLLDFDSRL